MVMRRHPLASNLAILLYIAFATTLFHLLTGNNYGYFIDELYTLACSRHISLAFVDIPPVTPALVALSTAIFGDSLFAIHIFHSIFSGVMVVFMGLITREMGGGRLAMITAGIAAAFGSVWMALGSLCTYDFVDQLTLVLLFFSLIKLLKSGNLKYWLLTGALAGIGLMVKPSEIFFIAAMVLGLLLTKHRRMLKTKWPWLGALIAAAIILPAVIWQAQNGFPIAEYWRSYSLSKTVHVDITDFLFMQIFGVHPLLLPVWLAGLFYVLFHKDGKRFRLLGIIYLILFPVFLMIGAKMYMPIPVYAALLAGGAVFMEDIAKKAWHKRLIAALLCLVAISGAMLAPTVMPILKVDALIKYYDTVGGMLGVKSVKLDNNGATAMPQYFYDRFEWDTLVRDVADVYHSLPEEQRKETAILGVGYGSAGAVDQLGKAYGLPSAMSGHLNYYYFSLDDMPGQSVIVIGGSQSWLYRIYSHVTLVKISNTRYRLPRQTPIYLCTDPKVTKEQATDIIKIFR